MADEVTVEQIADEMYKAVEQAMGKKNFKPGDLTKMMKKQFGVDKKMCKAAIRELMDSGRCVYSYFGGSFITLPHTEASNPDRED